MGGKVNPKAAAYALCDSMADKGKEIVSSCKKAMDICLKGDEGVYTAETDVGPVDITGDQQTCIAKLKKITSLGYDIKGGLFTPPKDQVTRSEADADTTPSASDESPAVEPEVTEGPAEDEVAPPAGEQYAGCSDVDAPGSEKYKTCASVVDICQASPDGPYKLYTNAGLVEPKSQEKCMKVSSVLAKMGYSLVDPEGIPEEETPDEPEAAEPALDTEVPGADDPDEDDATVQVKSFADINLRLKVTGEEYATEKRTLHFKGGKGIPIKLEYKIEQLPTGSYSMDYKVYKGKKQIGDEQSITFEASDGKIDLGFKIKLYDPDDFGSVESITIVEL